MLPRIVTADFTPPQCASSVAQHLVNRLLTPDPMRRITMSEASHESVFISTFVMHANITYHMSCCTLCICLRKRDKSKQ